MTDSFREDPVRILRVARFAARVLPTSPWHETMQLMREMVEHGAKPDHLVPGRAWQGTGARPDGRKPSRMFEVLRDVRALQVLLPKWRACGACPAPAPPRGGHRRA